MVLVERARSVAGRLAAIPGVRIQEFTVEPPGHEDEIEGAEDAIGHVLPQMLRRLYMAEARSCRLLWTASPEVFGADLRFGDLELLSPSALVEATHAIRDMADEARREYDLDEYPGWAAIARDWPHWIPVFAFGNGDYFCLDLKSNVNEPRMVFLVHDTMWDEPISHGQQVAANLTDLLQRWSKVGFVLRYSWSDVRDATGIDPSAVQFQRLRHALGPVP